MTARHFLVVGGAGVAGQSAIAAIRAREPRAVILATTSAAEREITGCTRAIGGVDLRREEAVTDLVAQIGEPLAGLVFTPAYGPVGFPAAEATVEQVAAARAFSLDPLRRLLESLQPTVAVAFSSFYWLPATLQAYGAMAHVKREMEEIAVAGGMALRVVRAGAFASRSAKALALAVYQQWKRGRHGELAGAWRGSGRRFFDHFYESAWRSEAEGFGHRFTSPHRPTEPADLRAAVELALSGEGAPLVNVIGDWQWQDDAVPGLPAPVATGGRSG